MIFNELSMMLLFISAIAYIVILLFLLLNRGIQESQVRYIVIYILISFSLDLVRVLLQTQLFELRIQRILLDLSIVVLVGLSVILLRIYSSILPVKSDNRLWYIVGLLFTLGLIFWSVVNLYNVINIHSEDEQVHPTSIIFKGVAVFAWALMIGRMVYLTFNSHRVIKRPLHKNRLTYWTVSFLFIVFGDVLFFQNVSVFGSPIHLAGVSVIVYILLTHNLIDIYRTGLQSLRYLLITFFAMLVYALLLLMLQPILQERPGYNALIGALVMAAILAITINPVINYFSKKINISLLGMDYDPNTVMREYSQSVSNIVDLKLLEQISMNLIKNTFGVDIGHLYIVDEASNGDKNSYELNHVGEDDESGIFKIEIQKGDPIAKRLSEEKLPLTQYDLDFHPLYRQSLLTGSRKYLSQEMEVFVPIHQDQHWIGLFAMGPKTSGDRFYDEELQLLATLADQSAVALENAKLFTRLQQINKELTLARRQLENVNARLKEIDQLKSAFISVITHEMRTPLANLGFALQIFEMYGFDNFSTEQKVQLEELHQGMNAARMMVDDLVTYATFLNDQAELKLEDVDIRDLVMNALKPHQAVAQEKGVHLMLDVSGKSFLIHADSKLLTNAICHLINNAVKFTEDGGIIVVNCWVKEDVYVINVKDTGIGISTERMANIWDAFVSSSNPLQRGWEGLGIGLALVKLIVEAHGGNVWVQSESGRGSDFGFQVPIIAQAINLHSL